MFRRERPVLHPGCGPATGVHFVGGVSAEPRVPCQASFEGCCGHQTPSACGLRKSWLHPSIHG